MSSWNPFSNNHQAPDQAATQSAAGYFFTSAADNEASTAP